MSSHSSIPGVVSWTGINNNSYSRRLPALGINYDSSFDREILKISKKCYPLSPLWPWVPFKKCQPIWSSRLASYNEHCSAETLWDKRYTFCVMCFHRGLFILQRKWLGVPGDQKMFIFTVYDTFYQNFNNFA